MAECPVSGRVDNKDYKDIYLFRADQNSAKEGPVAEFRVRNGRFSGTAVLDTTLVYEFIFTVPGSGIMQVRPFVPTQAGIHVVCPAGMTDAILLESGTPENMNMLDYEGIFRGLEPISGPIYQRYGRLGESGELFSDQMNALRDEALHASREQSAELWRQFNKLQKLDESYSEKGLAAKRELEAFEAMSDSLQRTFLAQHPDRLSSFYQVWQGIENGRQWERDIQSWLDLYDAHFAGRFPEHPYHTMVMGLTGNNVGEKIRDFVLPDTGGVQRRLSELVAGKMALVDFWASWCGSCRIRSKALIPIYEKYAGDDFTIVGVANEYDDDAKWRNAIKRDGYPWTNLIELEGKPAIRSSHSNVYLLDRDGVILSINPSIEEIESHIKAMRTENPADPLL